MNSGGQLRGLPQTFCEVRSRGQIRIREAAKRLKESILNIRTEVAVGRAVIKVQDQTVLRTARGAVDGKRIQPLFDV